MKSIKCIGLTPQPPQGGVILLHTSEISLTHSIYPPLGGQGGKLEGNLT